MKKNFVAMLSAVFVGLGVVSACGAQTTAETPAATTEGTTASQQSATASPVAALRPSPDAAPAEILGTWLLTKQDDQDVRAENAIVTFTADGKHTWGPALQDCVHTYKAPDDLKTDCSKSMEDFKIDYKVRSVNATTLVLVNPQVDQVNILERQP
jgi:hypothetical protein